MRERILEWLAVQWVRHEAAIVAVATALSYAAIFAALFLMRAIP